MQSDLIGKIEKAKRYAQEKERIKFDELKVTFQGDNTEHTTEFDGQVWHCSCRFFNQWGVCSHTMALEEVLGVMIKDSARTIPRE